MAATAIQYVPLSFLRAFASSFDHVAAPKKTGSPPKSPILVFCFLPDPRFVNAERTITTSQKRLRIQRLTCPARVVEPTPSATTRRHASNNYLSSALAPQNLLELRSRVVSRDSWSIAASLKNPRTCFVGEHYAASP